ncbi:MAG: insulinase family protein [Treponema sp.]|nr:insulinase family protein [Treponema sp.]
MNFNFKKILFITIIPLLSLVFAENTSFPNLYRYKLDNGLELFVAENRAAPLAYIEIAVRAGAVTQTPENAGLFHLYEHMMFKGNAKFEDQQAFTEGANAMGQIGQNGSTGVDRVNYFFTVPSSKVRAGIEFWSYAVRTPKLDEKELENEKAVVLSEINAKFSDPAQIRTSAIMRGLFPENPWRLDPAGNPLVVQNATADTLREMQKNYYIPQNSAIFVGGDVNHEEVFNYVKEIFSDWQNPSESPSITSFSTKTPLSQDKKLVFVDPGCTDSIISVAYHLRGPDGEADITDTYFADVWTSVVNNPQGLFATTFTQASELGIPDSDYLGASYLTRRDSGLVSFYGAMMNKSAAGEEGPANYGIGSIKASNKENLNPVEKAERFFKLLKNTAIPQMTKKEEFFKDKSIDFVIQQLEDSRIYDMESAQAILASLSYFWASCNADYFFNYDNSIASVTEDNVIEFVNSYLLEKNGFYVVTVSPGIWAKYKNTFLRKGYEEVSPENAFWHKDSNTENDAK